MPPHAQSVSRPRLGVHPTQPLTLHPTLCARRISRTPATLAPNISRILIVIIPLRILLRYRARLRRTRLKRAQMHHPRATNTHRRARRCAHLGRAPATDRRPSPRERTERKTRVTTVAPATATATATGVDRWCARTRATNQCAHPTDKSDIRRVGPFMYGSRPTKRTKKRTVFCVCVVCVAVVERRRRASPARECATRDDDGKCIVSSLSWYRFKTPPPTRRR